MIDWTFGPSLLIECQGTIAFLNGVLVNGEGTGVQIIRDAKVTLNGGSFSRNGININIVRSDGLMASKPLGDGFISRCRFASEMKAGIGVSGMSRLADTIRDECQLAGGIYMVHDQDRLSNR
jgi:hypothetical protein